MTAITEIQPGFISGVKESEDIFDSVNSFEATTIQSGYLQGLKEGKEEAAVQGFKVGFNTGSSISLELNYARAFATSILKSPPSNRPSQNLIQFCEEVLEKVNSFPATNVETEDVLAKSNDIKTLMDRIKIIITKKPCVDTTVKQKYTI